MTHGCSTWAAAWGASRARSCRIWTRAATRASTFPPRRLSTRSLLSEQEGWAPSVRGVLLEPICWSTGCMTCIFAHSVFTHLPPQQIEVMIRNAKPRLAPRRKFIFTYKSATYGNGTGLKQFSYSPRRSSHRLASRHGFYSEPLSYVWPAHQRTMRLTHSVDDDDDEEEDEDDD